MALLFVPMGVGNVAIAAEPGESRSGDPPAEQGEASRDTIDELLDRQADLEQPWDQASDGGRIERARAAGEVTDAQWVRFGLSTMQPNLQVRPRFRQGDVLPLMIDTADDLSRGGPTSGFEVRLHLDRVSLGEHRLDEGDGSYVFVSRTPNSMSQRGPVLLGLRSDKTDHLSLGSGRLTVEGRLELLEEAPSNPNTTLSMRPVMWSADVVVQARDDLSALVTTDPALRDAVHERVRVKALAPNWFSGINYDCYKAPVPTAWIPWIRRPGLEVPDVRPDINDMHGPLIKIPLTEAGEESRTAVFMPKPFLGFDLLDEEVVDIILWPDAEANAFQMDAAQIWGEPVVIRNVPVLKTNDPEVVVGVDAKAYNANGEAPTFIQLMVREAEKRRDQGQETD